MDMSLREWLILAGVVVILGILIDGYRRARLAKKESLEISQSMGGGYDNTPLDEDYNSELPNGPARVVKPSDNPDLEKPSIYQPPQKSAQVHEGFDESLETVLEETPEANEPSYSQDEEPVYSQDSDLNQDVDNSEFSEEYVTSEWGSAQDPDWDDSSEIITEDEAPAIKASEPEVDYGNDESITGHSTTDNIENDNADSSSRFGGIFKNGGFKSWGKSKEKPKQQEKGPSEVVVIHVMAKSAEGFRGEDLKHIFEACGMVLGEMSIFHRHEAATTDSPIQFSVANAVEPGIFDQSTINTMTTPGVSFFLSLPGPSDNIMAFDYMVETAQCVVKNLQGELKDEKRSNMNPQTIEHFRQKVRDFELKQLSARV